MPRPTSTRRSRRACSSRPRPRSRRRSDRRGPPARPVRRAQGVSPAPDGPADVAAHGCRPCRPVTVDGQHSRADPGIRRRSGPPFRPKAGSTDVTSRDQDQCKPACIHTSMAGARRLPRAARRAQLIEAAASAFLRRGYDKTSMEDVAQVAGVSRLIVYRNFESKDDLYRQVLRQLLADLGEAFSGLSFEDVAERGAPTVVLPVARANPDAFRLLWR